MPTNTKWSIIVLVVLLLIALPALLLPEALITVPPFEDSAAIFSAVVALLALDIFLPVPSSVISTSAGATLGVTMGTLASWLGMTVGCSAGYLVGKLARHTLLPKLMTPAETSRAEILATRFGFYFVLLARPVPILAELCVFYAGSTRLNFWTFLALVSVSNLCLSIIYGVVGDYTVSTGSFVGAALVAFLIPAIGLAVASRFLTTGHSVS